MSGMTGGLALLILAGVTNGSFTLPMKFARRWAWENTWLAFTVFALVVLPPLVTIFTVPRLGEVYGSVEPSLLITTALFGAGWGVAQVLFGIAVSAIGISLTFSIVLGLSAAVGCLIPLVRLHPDKVFSSGGLAVLSGVALVLAGVATCAVAGRRREAVLREGARDEGPAAGGGAMRRGLVLAVSCGLGASLLNLGLAFGEPLISAAEHLGAQPLWKPNVVWMPLMIAGAVPNIGYCVYLLRKNETTARFRESRTGTHWGFAAAMAGLWFSSNVLYGISAGSLGEFGAILGWPLYMSLIVITASAVGVLSGEWKGARGAPLRFQLGGVGILILAVFVLSAASRQL
jgi:L-rhamnose-H+ transport protein